MENILPSAPSITVHLWVGLALHPGNLTEEAGPHRVSRGHGIPDTPHSAQRPFLKAQEQILKRPPGQTTGMDGVRNRPFLIQERQVSSPPAWVMLGERGDGGSLGRFQPCTGCRL